MKVPTDRFWEIAIATRAIASVLRVKRESDRFPCLRGSSGTKGGDA
ncbi:MAG: hypothetical protein ACYT04_34535 [Nostoc sp.]